MSAAPRQIPAPILDRAGKACLALLVFLGVGALPSGLLMIARPDGSAFGFPKSWLENGPFHDYLIPGLILFGLFGVGSLLVAPAGWRRWRVAPFLAFALGVGMMIWIVVQIAIIRGLSILHLIYFVIGVAIAATAVRWGWPTFQAWRGRGA